jgi:assimilatory nitrate reductase catalytic subunit
MGRQLGQAFDTSKVICACSGVRLSAVEAAVAKGCASVDAVGEATGAGTNCGSCRPEIAAILPRRQAHAA